MASAKRTIDHDTIRQWVEKRGGRPAHVKRTASDGDPGILRIDFPGYSGEESLEDTSWDEWFDAFEQNQLAFLYQDESDSRFSKLVERRGDEPAASPRRWSSKTEAVTLENASTDELDAIWGIGPENAKRILAHQRQNGPIRSRDDLIAIDGIDGATADLVAREVGLR